MSKKEGCASIIDAFSMNKLINLPSANCELRALDQYVAKPLFATALYQTRRGEYLLCTSKWNPHMILIYAALTIITSASTRYY